MNDISRWRPVIPASRLVHSQGRISLRIRIVAVLAIVFGFLAVLALWRGNEEDPLTRLRGRTIDGRVGVFGYATLRSGVRTTDKRDHATLVELARRVEEDRTSANVHRLALANFVVGRLDAARQLLEEVRRLHPSDAAALSDLSAVRLELGFVADAAELAAQALKIDPSQAEAAFNYALALERLSNRPAAIEAWEAYLALDSSSQWATEARQHLSQIQQQRPTYEEQRHLLMAGVDTGTVQRLVRQFPQRTRCRGHNILLPAWVASGRDAELTVLRQIAEIRAATGDPYLQDIVEHAVAKRGELAPAMEEFTAGREDEANERWDRATLHFSNAAKLLERVGSPMAVGCTLYSAWGEFYNGRNDAALAQLKRVEAALTDGRYPAIAAEAAWLRGLMMVRLGRSHEGLAAYRRGFAEAKRSGEVESMASIGDLIASELEAVGDPFQADHYRLEILRYHDQIRAAPDRMYVLYLDTAFMALRSGRPHVALAFIESQTGIAKSKGSPLWLAESESMRALALLQLEDGEEAVTVLAAARAHAFRIPMADLRDGALAEIDYTEGRIEMHDRPERAVAAFSSALAIWNRFGWRLHSANALLARGDASLAAGDRIAAERDFRAGITEMEQRREGFQEPTLRVAYFERADGLFDRLIELLVRERRERDALSVVERKRARFLLDRVASNGHRGRGDRDPIKPAVPLDGDAIVQAIRGNTALLELALLDNRAEIWLVRGGRSVHVSVAVSRPAVEDAVQRHLQAIAARNEQAIRRSGRWLYDTLIAPVASEIAPHSDLVIVPDGVLQMFPFGTLVTREGAYLVDKYSLALSPSASVFVQSPAAAATTLVAVAEPAPAGFAALQFVAREATEIARRHSGGKVFIGAEVSPDRFLAAAANAAVVHFAGHARTDVERPERSALLFQSAEGDPVDLSAEVIARAHLRGHPLVVLAACSTARGKMRRNEGIDSLASAFLHAGARGVTATLWDIEDRASSKLFRSFHANLRTGARPSDALREAQRSLLHGGDPYHRNPAVWGSVTLLGTL